ncbi:glycosyl hydrolase family 28-related protein [Neorhizobium sp. CSC1952]|uniref:glycosyl hydrolase family 28-related protein n=1 Tax=Neorhizobium sp. CSC1952 TaxID=2978974 RepID=UPI0025A6852F|nr:glycosyl hydrolase family 28-related protein [Rhizobium sp. CSC1952]WJR67228.1 glycosyl hydrolase family 28-related protein [Rhizobium sp. CSC1952]
MTSLRLRVLPRYPARISGTNGLTVDREDADLVVKPDYEQLAVVPAVPDQDETFFQAWTRDIDSYNIIPFSSLVANIQDVIIGPNLAAIDQVTTGSDVGIYYTGEGEAATYTVSSFMRDLSASEDDAAFKSALGLGSAADEDVNAFATAAEGILASTAMQPATYDPTGKNQNVYAQAFRDDSPRYFGATGDGTTDDTTAYQLAEAGLSSVFLPGGNVFDIETAIPAKPIHGPGSIISDGVTLDGAQILHYADRSSVVVIPRTYTDDDWLYEEFPASSNQGNTMFGAGIQNTLDSNTVRTTAFGSLVLTKAQNVDRVSVYGQGAMRNTKFAQRIDGFGSLVMQWGGAVLTDDTSGKFYHHDLIFNGGGAMLVLGDPGAYTLNPAWTASNLYGLPSSVGQAIVDWINSDPWPTSNTDFSYNQAFGRDALCEIIKGSGNVAVGYRADSLLLQGNDNTAIGNNALFKLVFGDNNTALGKNAGWQHRTGNGNTYLGRNAGYSHDAGGSSVFIGNNAGNGSGGDLFTADWSVFIGQDAGVNPDGTVNANLSNRLFIQDRFTRSPLISGDFASGKIGVNLPIANPWRGMFHLFQGASGLNISDVAATGADGFVLENSAHTGFTILTPNTQIGGLYFADPEGLQQGGVSYNHSNDQLRLRIAGSNSFVISTTLANSLVPFARNGIQVLDTRQTGWGAPTGTATRTTFATSTVTLPQLAEHVKALIDDLTSHGLIGA